jgi:hypothetical protein
MKIGTQTKKNMLSSKITIAKVWANFQDGRRHHFENSSEYYKMGNYRPILMQFGTQTKTDLLSSKIAKAEAYNHFQDGSRQFENSRKCYKMGN